MELACHAFAFEVLAFEMGVEYLLVLSFEFDVLAAHFYTIVSEDAGGEGEQSEEDDQGIAGLLLEAPVLFEFLPFRFYLDGFVVIFVLDLRDIFSELVIVKAVVQVDPEAVVVELGDLVITEGVGLVEEFVGAEPVVAAAALFAEAELKQGVFHGRVGSMEGDICFTQPIIMVVQVVAALVEQDRLTGDVNGAIRVTFQDEETGQVVHSLPSHGHGLDGHDAECLVKGGFRFGISLLGHIDAGFVNEGKAAGVRGKGVANAAVAIAEGVGIFLVQEIGIADIGVSEGQPVEHEVVGDGVGLEPVIEEG